VVVIALFLPRLAIAALYLFTNYLGVYSTVLWPVLGFFFAPYTTLAVAVAYHSGGVSGVYLVLVIIAVLADLGALEGGRRGASRAPRR
jgi:hypothetical protein